MTTQVAYPVVATAIPEMSTGDSAAVAESTSTSAQRRLAQTALTPVRIRLQAANLPRQGLFGLPDTYAIVTSILGGQFGEQPQSGARLEQPISNNIASSQNDENTNDPLQGYVWGKTETVFKSKNPQWTKTILMQYESGTDLYFYVHVMPHYDPTSEARTSSSKHIKSFGTALFEVGDILGTLNSTKVKRLRGGGCVLCRVEPVVTDNLAIRVNLQLEANDLVPPHARLRNTLFHASTTTDTILEIERRPPDRSSRQSWVSVYRSPAVKGSLNPMFEEANIDLCTLCNGDYDRHLRFSVYQLKANGATQLIGMSETTLKHLISARTQTNKPGDGEVGKGDNVQEYLLQRNDSKEVGRLKVLKAEVVSTANYDSPASSQHQEESVVSPQRDSSLGDNSNAEVMEVVDLAALKPLAAPTVHRFQEYVNQGCQIDLCVAIDFTSSNGDPRKEGSLHYQGGGDCLNDYEETIKAIGPALTAYSPGGSSEAECTVWGFGAKFGGEVRHLFQCGSDRTVMGVDGILAAYQSMFASGLIMSGPTVFLQVIQAAAVRAREQHLAMTRESLRYTVLLVITDGIMNNFEETQRKLAVYSEMPLSVVFVGVGNTDFGLMYYLCDQRGSRPNATFVEFRRLQHDPRSLGEAALNNIPQQLCEYMGSGEF